MRDRQEVKRKLNPNKKETAKEPPRDLWTTKQISIAIRLSFTQCGYILSTKCYNLEEVGCVPELKTEWGQ